MQNNTKPPKGLVDRVKGDSVDMKITGKDLVVTRQLYGDPFEVCDETAFNFHKLPKSTKHISSH